MSRKKSFDCRTRLGAIYSSSKTKERIARLAIGLGCKNQQTLELIVAKIRIGGLIVLSQSNSFSKSQNYFKAEIQGLFRYRLPLQRFL